MSVNKPRLLPLHLFTSNTLHLPWVPPAWSSHPPDPLWFGPFFPPLSESWCVSECQTVAKRLSLRQRGNPDAATHSAFQQQTHGDMYMLSLASIYSLQPSGSNWKMSLNFSPLMQYLCCQTEAQSLLRKGFEEGMKYNRCSRVGNENLEW